MMVYAIILIVQALSSVDIGKLVIGLGKHCVFNHNGCETTKFKVLSGTSSQHPLKEDAITKEFP